MRQLRLLFRVMVDLIVISIVSGCINTVICISYGINNGNMLSAYRGIVRK